MNIVYDLFLNFQDIAYEFFEWQKQDEIEHIKKMPMFLVDTKTLNDFLIQDVVVDNQFLNEIYNITEKYDLTKLEYACVLTDTNIALAVEFNSQGYCIYKSRLLLEDEEEICKFANKKESVVIKYDLLSIKEKQIFFTRRERKLKNYLKREILKVYNNKEHSKLQYLYLEYFNSLESDLKVMKDKLLESMETSLNDKHVCIYDLLMLMSRKKKV